MPTGTFLVGVLGYSPCLKSGTSMVKVLAKKQGVIPTNSLIASDTLVSGEAVDNTALAADLRAEEERNWIEQAIKGDRDSFKYLFERYYLRLKSVALGILMNEEDAADVCQEAFFKAHRNLSTFRGGSSFYTWMYRIVYNLCIDLSRKSYRKREILNSDDGVFEKNASNSSHSEYSPPLPTSPEEELYRVRLGETIKVAMESLSPPHRLVIRLREIDGLSYEEISKATGCSTGTVMSRLHHARKKLMSVLSDMLGEKDFGDKHKK